MWVAHTFQISCLVLKGLATEDQHFLSCNFCPCDVGKINYSWLPECKNSDDNTTFKSSPAVGEFLAFKFGSQTQHYNYLFSHWKIRFSFVYYQLLKVFILIHFNIHCQLVIKNKFTFICSQFPSQFFFWMCICKMCRLNMGCCKVKKLLNLPTKETQIQLSFLGQSGS